LAELFGPLLDSDLRMSIEVVGLEYMIDFLDGFYEL